MATQRGTARAWKLWNQVGFMLEPAPSTVLGGFRCVFGLELDQLGVLDLYSPLNAALLQLCLALRGSQEAAVDSHQKGCVSIFFVPLRGHSRHIYSCILAFLPYLKLPPAVGSESVGISSELVGAVQTYLCTQPHSVLFFLILWSWSSKEASLLILFITFALIIWPCFYTVRSQEVLQ